MSWGGIIADEAVSFADAADAVTLGIFTALTGFSASAECMTKSDASTYLNVNTGYAPFAILASNELVKKSDLTTAGYTAHVISQGYSSGVQCGGLGEAYQTVYAAEAAWLDVTVFYTDAALTTPFDGGSLWYGDQYATWGTTVRIATNGLVTGQYAC